MTRLLYLLCLSAGIFIGANSGGFLTISKSPKPQPEPIQGSIIPSDIIKANSIAVETYYQVKLDSLTQSNSTLGQQVITAKTALQQVKKDNKALREVVDTLISHAQQDNDTVSMLARCDSVEAAVHDLIATANADDSLYENVTTGLQAQLYNKDSAMAVQQQAYNALRLSLDNSLAQQDVLTSQSHWYETQLKKQKINNKLLSVGLTVMTGVATYSLIRHK